jgi:hypothetical protein
MQFYYLLNGQVLQVDVVVEEVEAVGEAMGTAI